jgi:hypothetical protein
MGWEELLQDATPSRLVMPWLGGRRIYRDDRAWRVDGKLPREFGWYLWNLVGRNALLLEEAEPDLSYGETDPMIRGYLVGDRLVPWNVQVKIGLGDVFNQTKQVALVEPGLDRFTFVDAVYSGYSIPIYRSECFPLGPEGEVRRAFVDRKESIDDIKGVVPALDFAFRFATHQRKAAEERRAELERKRLEEERIEQARKNMGTGLGRRTLASTDFPTAAKAALKVGGAELLDVRPGRGHEAVVQFRLEGRRFECVAERTTLRIIDSGICLEDHGTHEKGDTYFTLESLPGVIQQAMREGRLHVYRHVDEDYGEEWT